MLIVQALLQFVLGEAMWGKEANSNGSFLAAQSSHKMEAIKTYAILGVSSM